LKGKGGGAKIRERGGFGGPYCCSLTPGGRNWGGGKKKVPGITFGEKMGGQDEET